MKLLRVNVIKADTCGGLLDGFDFSFRSPTATEYSSFAPLCLIGPNGAGKSQFLQILTEIFQAVFHTYTPNEERKDGNPTLQFEVEYLIRPNHGKEPVHVKVVRKSPDNRRKPQMNISTMQEGEWKDCAPDRIRELLPTKVIGYTSGDNETLSLPYLISRAKYADEVTNAAFHSQASTPPDTKLMLIDYGTNLEIVVSNLLMAKKFQLEALLDEIGLEDIFSFRCVIQLVRRKSSKSPAIRINATSKRKDIQLTDELETCIQNLLNCATCYSYDESNERYVLDFWVDYQTKIAFHSFWERAFDLYSALNKLAMLNDLAIPKYARDRFQSNTQNRQFATKLPEPQDEEKVFRFEQVRFKPKAGSKIVDYVALSDGEHQLAQIFGIFSMLSFPNVLFILDEPESHLNPKWRVKFISYLMNLPTNDGVRSKEVKSSAAEQDCLLTTHAPFVPSDMTREQVIVFKKENNEVKVDNPQIETFGTTFDTILDECFGVRPPISGISRQEIDNLMKSEDPEEIKTGIARLGDSVEKVYLAEHLLQVIRGKK